MNPKVSVIIPYKEDRFLEEAIESVKNQTYKNWELIKVKSDARIGTNINVGASKATGDFIAILAEDDLLPPNSLEDRVNGMKDFDFIHTRGKMFGSRDGEWPLTNPYCDFNYLLKENGIMGGTPMYRREIFKEFKWDENLWTAEEREFHLQLLYAGKRIGFVDKFCYLYRRHNNQKSIGSQEYMRQREAEKLRMLKKYESL